MSIPSCWIPNAPGYLHNSEVNHHMYQNLSMNNYMQTHQKDFMNNNQSSPPPHGYSGSSSSNSSQTLNSAPTYLKNNNSNTIEQQLQQQQHQSLDAISNSSNQTMIEHLNLSKFKVEICPNLHIQHSHKQCQYYHNQKDRRRINVNYSSNGCAYIDSFGTGCPYGDECPKSHNKVEQLYRPEKYKTKFCTQYPSSCESCEYGVFCSFAHSETDIQIELLHNYTYDTDFYVFFYKTVSCPFNYINHDRGMCVYSHNWQDFRRRPSQIEYTAEKCSQWDPNSFITDYEVGCSNGTECTYCHGWNELDYHPKTYHTQPCSTHACNKSKACPNYHHQSERRIFSSNVNSELFRYAPRNRITKGVFKQNPQQSQWVPREIKSTGGTTQTNGQINSQQMQQISPTQQQQLLKSSSSHSKNSNNNNGSGQQSQSFQKKKLTRPLLKMNTCSDFDTSQNSTVGSSSGKQVVYVKKEQQVQTTDAAQSQQQPLNKQQQQQQQQPQQQQLSHTIRKSETMPLNSTDEYTEAAGTIANTNDQFEDDDPLGDQIANFANWIVPSTSSQQSSNKKQVSHTKSFEQILRQSNSLDSAYCTQAQGSLATTTSPAKQQNNPFSEQKQLQHSKQFAGSASQETNYDDDDYNQISAMIHNIL